MRVPLPPKQRIHQTVYIFAIAILIIGLPLSKFLMSVSQIILSANWLLEGNLGKKFRQFYRNKAALVASSLLLLHILALVYSGDLDYGFHDVKIKVPLLVLPLIISTSPPVSREVFNRFLQLFLGSLVIASIISTLILTDTIIHRKVVDIRDISIFISHIRFGLLLCLGVFVTIYLFVTAEKFLQKLIYGLLLCWLLAFLVIMESITGLSTLFITLFLLIMIKGVIPESKALKWVRLGLATLLMVFIVYLYKIFTTVQTKVTHAYTLLEKTEKGNVYHSDTAFHQTENGYLVWVNFSPEELEETWNKRSKINYHGKDLKGNSLSATLIRFLASKGLNKDAAGVNSLTEEEIKAIERGVANVNYMNMSNLPGRLHELIWEIDLYKTTGDANGHSLTQRFEYWKTAWAIIKRNFLLGVGTGDVAKAFAEQYERSHSTLSKEWRLRAHNQYLSILVGMGIIGFLWFLFTLFFPVYRMGMQSNYLYISFLIIVLVSFFTEDTLETQAGVTFFAFFNSFFLFMQTQRLKEQ